eukprot:5991198-Pyramimonas_sp.AAC.1
MCISAASPGVSISSISEGGAKGGLRGDRAVRALEPEPVTAEPPGTASPPEAAAPAVGAT